MKVLNIMLSRDLGGIQQAFLDYNTALEMQNIEVINVTSYNAKINSFLLSSSLKLFNLAPIDPVSVVLLKYIIYKTKPDIIIAHGNRAINFSKLAKLRNIKLLGIAHNYSLKGLLKCDYVIALTYHMKEFLLKNNFVKSQIFILPNMINISKKFTLKPYKKPIRPLRKFAYREEFVGDTQHSTAAYTLVREDASSGSTHKLPLEVEFPKRSIVIGVLARFVAKKGIDVFIKAIKILQDKNYEIQVVIGGDGEEKENLISLTNNLNLQNKISFIGWVKDKDKFFEQIDIFCLPSLHEPFGIIVLEAMEAGLPIVSTDTEGPAEILRDMQDGLICRVGSAEDLAEKISYILDNPTKAEEFSKNAYLRLQQNYDIKVVAKKLLQYLQKIA